MHRERFGRPGLTLLGSDSHTTTGGCLGMLAMGAGGLEIALAMSGQPYRFPTPEVWGIRVTGTLPPWVSGKDLILELLRRFSAKGATGKVLEFFGPGVAALDLPRTGHHRQHERRHGRHGVRLPLRRGHPATGSA